MLIKELRALIANAPDDAVILTPTSDHGLRVATVVLDTALKERGGTWTEDFGEEMTPQKQYGKRLPALVVS